MLPVLFLALAACAPRGGRVPAPPDTGHASLPDEDTASPGDSDSPSPPDSGEDTAGAEETGDTGQEPREPRYFRPEYIYASLLAGHQDGQLVEIRDTAGGATPPYLAVYLATRAWFETYDEDQVCVLYWQVSAAPHAPFDWDLGFTPWSMSQKCTRLDPDVYGEAPLQTLGVSEGFAYIADFTALTLTTLVDVYGWDPTSETYDLFAGELSVGDLDATLNAFATWYPGMQPWYGAAYAVNDEMESSFDTLLTLEQIWAGEPAVYYLTSYTYMAPGG